MSDLETVPGAASALRRRCEDGEMVFTLSSAIAVVRACTLAGVAVLGIEVFPGLNVSTYDLQLKDPPAESSWSGYVKVNNALAEDFIRKNPASEMSECILTTASWREFCEIKRQQKSL